MSDESFGLLSWVYPRLHSMGFSTQFTHIMADSEAPEGATTPPEPAPVAEEAAALEAKIIREEESGEAAAPAEGSRKRSDAMSEESYAAASSARAASAAPAAAPALDPAPRPAAGLTDAPPARAPSQKSSPLGPQPVAASPGREAALRDPLLNPETPPVPSGKWACAVCTFHNADDFPRCAVCGQGERLACAPAA
jgi:hypothetical protein